MKRFKRCLVLGVALLFTAFFMGGCALFAQNIDLNNKLVVAVVGEVNNPIVTIYKRQLSDAYGSWGYQYVQQGYSQQQAVEATLEMLVNREIMAHMSASEQWFGTYGHGITETLTLEESYQALRQVFSNMDSNIKAVGAEIRKERGVEDPELGEAPTDDTPTHDKLNEFKPYIKQELLANGIRQFSLDLSQYEAKPEKESTPPTVQEYIASLLRLEGVLAPRHSGPSEESIASATLERAVRYLKTREQGVADNWTNEKMLTEEINRQLRNAENDILVGRFRDMFNQGVMSSGSQYFVDFMNRFEDKIHFMDLNGNDLTAEQVQALPGNVEIKRETAFERWQRTISQRNREYVNEKVVQAREIFSREVRTAINRYQMGLDTNESIAQKILDPSDFGSVRWIPSSIVNDYFTISHVLVSFSTEQRAELGNLKTRLNQGLITELDYNRQVDHMRNSLTVRERDADGKEFGPYLTARQVMNRIENEVLSTDEHGNITGDVNAFQRMIYAFNGDPGIMNADFEYTMGRDTRQIDTNTGKPIGEDKNTGMVTEFTDASRALYNWQNGRAMGKVGDMTHSRSGIGDGGLVWSQFGAHIIMYTRKVSDFIFSNSETMLASNIDAYLFATQTSYGEKTYFDTIVEGLNQREYQSAENAVLIAFKQSKDADKNLVNPITTFPHRFNDLW